MISLAPEHTFIYIPFHYNCCHPPSCSHFLSISFSSVFSSLPDSPFIPLHPSLICVISSFFLYLLLALIRNPLSTLRLSLVSPLYVGILSSSLLLFIFQLVIYLVLSFFYHLSLLLLFSLYLFRSLSLALALSLSSFVKEIANHYTYINYKLQILLFVVTVSQLCQL